MRSIESDGPLSLDEPVPDILAGEYSVVLKRIQTRHLGEYLGIAARHYGHVDFEALVLFWPDREHRFPWEPGCLVGQQEALSLVGLAG